MAIALASLHESVPGSKLYYDVTVDCQVLFQLEQNFSDGFIPVLFIGRVNKRLKDSLPREFLDNQEDSDEESEDSSSQSEEPKEDRLMVWPKPVAVQGRNLLLMKMWDFDINEKNEDKRQAVVRCLAAFLSLSAHGVVNFEPKVVFHGLDFLQSLHESLLRREGGGLHRVHFVVLSKGKKHEIDEYKSRPEGQLTDFVSKKDWRRPDRFFHHLLNGPDTPVASSMHAWARNLLLVMKFVNIDSDREFFVQHFPRFNLPQIESFEEMLEEFEQKQKTLRQASVNKFIVRSRSPFCKFDERFLATLQKDLYQAEGTVVVAVIGEPGVGKSTFLNHLIQRTFRSRTLRPYFAMGSTPRHRTTNDSSILYCPLPGSPAQMLLVDLEGLVDAGSLSESEALTQSNLVSGVLAVTSVPCFFVKNPNAHQQKQVEWYIERYVFLSQNFHCERIFVFSYDDDFQQSDNVKMKKWVATLNKRFFRERPAVHLMSKPSFDNPGKADMCRDFLDAFLKECNFQKGCSVEQTLAKICSISQTPNTEQGQFTVDFAHIDALKNKKVQQYKSKSEILLCIESSPEENSYSVRVNSEAMQKLHTNFTACSAITPVLCIGNSVCGRSAILDSLLRRELDQFYDANAELGNFSNFASEERPPGVYVWPNPVRLGDATLLLIKMWGVDFRDSNKALSAFNDQVISALLCITSVCLVCTEKNSLFHSLESVQKLSCEVGAVGLAVSQFVVFAERTEQFASPESQEKLRSFRTSADGPITQFLYRGNIGISESCADELCRLLSNPNLHNPFLESHLNIAQKINAGTMAGGITQMLDSLIRVVNFDLDYHSFVRKIPRFDERFEQRMEELADFEEYLRRVRDGEALKLLIRDGESCRFDSSVIQTLRENYKLEEPVIVMVIIENPGMGKSTFLNRLIQASTGSRQCLEPFKTGNTALHTTKESQVFSQPLNLCGNQLMLIDLEGLGGTETIDKAEADLQKKLVSAILRVASVPCILVKNEQESMKFVHYVIKKLDKHKKSFGLPIERVHLLFHDRDMNVQGSNNPHFEQFVNQVQHDYYANSPVVKMRNKPAFSVTEKASMCEAFLEDLLEDSNFPKLNQSGDFTIISKLLLEMAYVMGHRSMKIAEVVYSIEEAREIMRIETEQHEQLKKIADGIICRKDGMSLITIFNQRYEEFKIACFSKMAGQTENVKKHATTALETEAGEYRLELSQTEYCYRAVRLLTTSWLRSAVKELLGYFYRESWWINTFLKRAKDIKKKLFDVKKRYPQEDEKISDVLQSFDKKRNELRNWFIAHYSFNICTTGAFGGLGLAVKGVSLAITAERLIAAAVIGGLASIGRLTYSAAHSLVLMDTAVELFNMNLFSMHLNSRVSNLLQVRDDQRLYVMLVLGTGKAMPSYLLNEFVHQVLPFTSYSIKAFKKSKLTQIAHCPYQHPGNQVRDVNTHAVIIYLRMKTNMNKRDSMRVRKLATELFLRVPRTCLLFKKPDLFAENILDGAFAARGGWTSSFCQPKLVVIHNRESRRSDFFTKLVSFDVPHVEVGIENFNEQGLKIALMDVKREFDESTPISPSTLLRVLKNAEVNASR